MYGMLDNLDKSNVDKKGLPFTVRTVFISEFKLGVRIEGDMVVETVTT